LASRVLEGLPVFVTGGIASFSAVEDVDFRNSAGYPPGDGHFDYRDSI
jgi:hypothetical protein